ncbi:GAF and ANTAR domain-containing protein [Nocardioides pinisoli]|uniref:GAF and ANTAR domain-containing protein n=1 Tax=Nocardioides pinisoli TaxID=2950279 RepID=A0ABT1L1H2_9ACTN|nr:GAF and ANTAR domain-containing protein [Nocardioides pinisoli]MCP3423847.1 GAF and ANTAR domain-containing protein [Nocardioides pinisoli]
MDRYEFNRQLADAARATAEANDSDDTLERAVQTALELVGSADLAGLSVFTPGGVHTPAATHEDLRHIEQLQHELGEGPCLSALRETDVIRVGDVTTDTRWGRWGPAIGQKFDIRSALAFHLFTDGHQLAAMTLYARKPDSFDHDDVVDGLAVAAQAAVTLAGTTNRDQMNQAMRNRQVIGEATGMLRERFDLTSARAFDVLKRLSSHHNVKVARIAQYVVDTGDLPEPPAQAAHVALSRADPVRRSPDTPVAHP